MIWIKFYTILIVSPILLISCSSHVSESHSFFSSHRHKRDITRADSNQQIFYNTLPNQYGSPSSQELLYNQIHSELSEIENLLKTLLDHLTKLQNIIVTSRTLPREYGPSDQAAVDTEKYAENNYALIQAVLNYFKTVAQHLEGETHKHKNKKHHSENGPLIQPNQHYHVSAAGILPEFLTLDPFVAYGPAPMINFAPPAPGANTGSAQDIDIYSPPDGVLLAPPGPGKLPIRSRGV